MEILTFGKMNLEFQFFNDFDTLLQRGEKIKFQYTKKILKNIPKNLVE
jgi:hypothetical protein